MADKCEAIPLEEGATLNIKKQIFYFRTVYEVTDKDGNRIYTAIRKVFNHSELKVFNHDHEGKANKESKLDLVKFREKSLTSVVSKMKLSTTSEEPLTSKDYSLEMTNLYSICCGKGPQWDLRSGDGELIIRNDEESSEGESYRVAKWWRGGRINSKIFANHGETQVGRIVGKRIRRKRFCNCVTRHHQEVRIELQEEGGRPLNFSRDALLAAYLYLDSDQDWWKEMLDLITSILTFIAILAFLMGRWYFVDQDSASEETTHTYWPYFFILVGTMPVICFILYLVHMLNHKKTQQP